jgi:hypothetical protein
MDIRLSTKVRFEELPIDEKFKSVFEDYKRQVQEGVLYDVLTQFYFADWTRACDYEKMTSEEVVKAAMAVCKKLEEHYKYSLDDDLF